METKPQTGFMGKLDLEVIRTQPQATHGQHLIKLSPRVNCNEGLIEDRFQRIEKSLYPNNVNEHKESKS